MAWGAGLEDGARHFVKHKRSSTNLRAAAGALGDKNKSVLTKAKIVNAVAAHIATTASPIGLVRNTYLSVKEGAKSYNAVRDEEFIAAVEELVGPDQNDAYEVVRRAALNPALPGTAPVTVGPLTQQRFLALWRDFELG